MPTPRKKSSPLDEHPNTGTARTVRKKSSALGDVSDILAGPAPSRATSVAAAKPTSRTESSKQRDTGGDGKKMQTIYLHANDIDRANELEYRVKKSRSISGRVGLSLMLRAGLKLLEDAFSESEEHALELVASIASEGK